MELCITQQDGLIDKHYYQNGVVATILEVLSNFIKN